VHGGSIGLVTCTTHDGIEGVYLECVM
jgi:hypothetical protein